MKQKDLLPMIHPGEILLEEFIRPMGLTLASEITKCRRGISAETALRLAKFFGTSAGFWVGLQADHDLEAAERTVGRKIAREVSALA